jgi:hypothetical protein
MQDGSRLAGTNWPLNRARIVETPPSDSSPHWSYTLVAVGETTDRGIPLLHTWAPARAADGRPDPAERRDAIHLLSVWATAHGWTLSDPPDAAPYKHIAIGTARLIDYPPPRGMHRRFLYALQAVEGPVARGTLLQMASARRLPNGDRQSPQVDPAQRDRAQAELRAWAAAHGWRIVDTPPRDEVDIRAPTT